MLLFQPLSSAFLRPARGYRREVTVVAVPRGSQWTLTLSDAFASIETRVVNTTVLQRYQRACKLTPRKAWHCRHACVVARLNGSPDPQRGTALRGLPIESSSGMGVLAVR